MAVKTGTLELLFRTDIQGRYSDNQACVLQTGLVISGCPLAGPGGAAYRAFGFLAAAAPCALMMTPLAYVAAIGACAQRGVLVRGGKTLDELYNTRTVALDKTGEARHSDCCSCSLN